MDRFKRFEHYTLKLKEQYIKLKKNSILKIRIFLLPADPILGLHTRLSCILVPGMLE